MLYLFLQISKNINETTTTDLLERKPSLEAFGMPNFIKECENKTKAV